MPLEEATFDLTEMAHQSGNNKRFAADDTLLVRFFTEPMIDQAKTAEEGRPIYRNAEMISIMVPGQRDSAVIRKARQTDKLRFPRHYQAFQLNASQDNLEGTPLTEWPQISKALVLELQHFNVRTVEQLVEMPDSHAQNFMAIGSIRSKAKVWLDNAADGAAAVRLQEELSVRDNEIQALREAVEQQAAQIANLLAGDVGANTVSERGDQPGSG